MKRDQRFRPERKTPFKTAGIGQHLDTHPAVGSVTQTKSGAKEVLVREGSQPERFPLPGLLGLNRRPSHPKAEQPRDQGTANQ